MTFNPPKGSPTMNITDLLAGLDTSATPAPDRSPVATKPLAMPTLALPLLDYQVEGVTFAMNQRRSYIADEMGLGKTAQGIALAVAAIDAGLSPVLVVVPPSLRLNWVREFGKFSPATTVATLTGRTLPDSLPQAQVLIIGDAVLPSWADEDTPFLPGKVKALIVDEAHRIKNPKALRTASIKRVVDALPSDGLVTLLSGTPLIAHPGDLAMPITILSKMNRFGGSIGNYLDTYCPKNRLCRFGSREVDLAMLPDLHERLLAGDDPFMIRRSRADVVSLPSKGRVAVTFPMSKALERRYLSAHRDLLSYLSSEGYSAKRLASASRAEALVKMGHLRRLAAEGIQDSVCDHVRGILAADPQAKVFVAAVFRDDVDVLATALGAVKIKGGMSDKAKMASVDSFQNDPECRVLVGNIQAAGVGFNLTAGSHCVVASLPWDSASLTQAEDRLHRIGQERDVLIHVGVAGLSDGTPSISENLWTIIQTKHGVSSTVIDGEAEDLLSGNGDARESLLAMYGG